MVNKEKMRKVNELMICCTNHREGCGWAGKLGGLKIHLDSNEGCGYVEVTCTNEECWEIMYRKDLQTHLQEFCYYRPYECEHCGHKDTYTAITGKKKCMYGHPRKHIRGHYTECLEYPLACPNRCGVTGIRRRAMPDHHSSCPLEPLDCPFKDAGCTEKIARKDMEHHMTANQQKHMLLTFQSLQQANEHVKQDLNDTKRELNDMKQELHDTKRKLEDTKQELEDTKQKLCATKQELYNELQSANGLCKVGDIVTFQVRDLPQLRKEEKAWYSPPFSIGDEVRVRLAVYPSGVGRGQESHVSVSLILAEVLKREQHIWLEYNVSVAAIGHTSATPKTLELCSLRKGDNSILLPVLPACSARFRFPSPGEVLRSEEQFLEIEEANSLLANDAMTLELKLLKHQHKPLMI